MVLINLYRNIDEIGQQQKNENSIWKDNGNRWVSTDSYRSSRFPRNRLRAYFPGLFCYFLSEISSTARVRPRLGGWTGRIISSLRRLLINCLLQKNNSVKSLFFFIFPYHHVAFYRGKYCFRLSFKHS